jgi:hypothetical protein
MLDAINPVYKSEITAIGIRSANHATPFYPQKLVLASLGRHSSLADSSHGVVVDGMKL